jgi:hypothetical protein
MPHRCIKPMCDSMGCVMCNCAVPETDVKLNQCRADAAREAEAGELDCSAGAPALRLSDGLGLLPNPTIAWPGEAYTPTETLDYALREVQRAVAAERERCALLCETWMEAAERKSGPEAAGWLHQIAQHMRGA